MATRGIAFRQTSGYVADAATDTYCLGETYPVTRNSIGPFGFTIFTGQGRDRDNTLDVRLAGINFQTNLALQGLFQWDGLTAGVKNIRLALGDGGATQAYQYIQILDSDGITVLFTITDTDGTAVAEFDDASGVNRTAAAWPGSNVAVQVTLSGTSLFFKLGAPTSQTGSSTIAYISVEDVGGGSVAQPEQKVILKSLPDEPYQVDDNYALNLFAPSPGIIPSYKKSRMTFTRAMEDNQVEEVFPLLLSKGEKGILIRLLRSRQIKAIRVDDPNAGDDWLFPTGAMKGDIGGDGPAPPPPTNAIHTLGFFGFGSKI